MVVAINTKSQYLTVGLETQNGTQVIPTNAIQFVEEGIIKTIEQIQSESQQNVLNNLVFVGEGSDNTEGTLSLEVNPIESPFRFLLALGKITSADVSSGTDGSVYKHTIEEEVCSYKSLSLEHKGGDCSTGATDGQTQMIKRAYGTVLDTLALAIEGNAYAKLDLGLKSYGMFDVARVIANESAEVSSTAITNITHSGTTATVTSTTHGLAVGDIVKIASVGGATEANGYQKVLTVADASTFTFELASMTTYTTGGTVEKIAMFYFEKGKIKGIVAGDSVKLYESTTGTYEDVTVAYVDEGNSVVAFDAVTSALFTVANGARVYLNKQSPTYETPLFFTFDDFEVREGDTVALAEASDPMNVESATFNIMRNVVSKVMSVNNITAPTGMNSDLNVTKLYENNSERDSFRALDEKAYSITLTNNQVISATDTGNLPYKIKITIPRATKKSFEITNAKNDVIGETFVTDILHDTTLAYSIKVEVWNGKEGAYYTTP